MLTVAQMRAIARKRKVLDYIKMNKAQLAAVLALDVDINVIRSGSYASSTKASSTKASSTKASSTKASSTKASSTKASSTKASSTKKAQQTKLDSKKRTIKKIKSAKKASRSSRSTSSTRSRSVRSRSVLTDTIEEQIRVLLPERPNASATELRKISYNLYTRQLNWYNQVQARVGEQLSPVFNIPHASNSTSFEASDVDNGNYSDDNNNDNNDEERAMQQYPRGPAQKARQGSCHSRGLDPESGGKKACLSYTRGVLLRRCEWIDPPMDPVIKSSPTASTAYDYLISPPCRLRTEWLNLLCADLEKFARDDMVDMSGLQMLFPNGFDQRWYKSQDDYESSMVLPEIPISTVRSLLIDLQDENDKEKAGVWVDLTDKSPIWKADVGSLLAIVYFVTKFKHTESMQFSKTLSGLWSYVWSHLQSGARKQRRQELAAIMEVFLLLPLPLTIKLRFIDLMSSEETLQAVTTMATTSGRMSSKDAPVMLSRLINMAPFFFLFCVSSGLTTSVAAEESAQSKIVSQYWKMERSQLKTSMERLVNGTLSSTTNRHTIKYMGDSSKLVEELVSFFSTPIGMERSYEHQQFHWVQQHKMDQSTRALSRVLIQACEKKADDINSSTSIPKSVREEIETLHQGDALEYIRKRPKLNGVCFPTTGVPLSDFLAQSWQTTVQTAQILLQPQFKRLKETLPEDYFRDVIVRELFKETVVVMMVSNPELMLYHVLARHYKEYDSAFERFAMTVKLASADSTIAPHTAKLWREIHEALHHSKVPSETVFVRTTERVQSDILLQAQQWIKDAGFQVDDATIKEMEAYRLENLPMTTSLINAWVVEVANPDRYILKDFPQDVNDLTEKWKQTLLHSMDMYMSSVREAVEKWGWHAAMLNILGEETGFVEKQLTKFVNRVPGVSSNPAMASHLKVILRDRFQQQCTSLMMESHAMGSLVYSQRALISGILGWLGGTMGVAIGAASVTLATMLGLIGKWLFSSGKSSSASSSSSTSASSGSHISDEDHAAQVVTRMASAENDIMSAASVSANSYDKWATEWQIALSKVLKGPSNLYLSSIVNQFADPSNPTLALLSKQLAASKINKKDLYASVVLPLCTDAERRGKKEQVKEAIARAFQFRSM